MGDAVEELIARMHASSRMELLKILADTIMEMTLVGRSSYDSDAAVDDLRRTNEMIHRIMGHLRDFLDSTEAFTESRAKGIAEQLQLLDHPSTARIDRRMG